MSILLQVAEFMNFVPRLMHRHSINFFLGSRWFSPDTLCDEKWIDLSVKQCFVGRWGWLTFQMSSQFICKDVELWIIDLDSWLRNGRFLHDHRLLEAKLVHIDLVAGGGLALRLAWILGLIWLLVALQPLGTASLFLLLKSFDVFLLTLDILITVIVLTML